ncbi:MAG: hypothetical protein BroJett040_12460 [Oligoflexia bacterium]|nr:MAG: hypothetical protein BroJett040_12460 [Oligoflexia bacterium]
MGALIKSAQESKIQVDRKEMGKADTLRYNVLVFVVDENYDRAIAELKEYLEIESEYPRFHEKIERYIRHAVDLVNAIRAKRKFPGAHSLTVAKQQELNERFHEHFNELQHILKRIEKVEHDMKVEDVRSTVYVVKALVNAAFAIAILGFFLEISRGLLKTMWVVTDDFFLSITDWIFKFIKI